MDSGICQLSVAGSASSTHCLHRSWSVGLLILLACIGCGDAEAQKQLDLAKQTVQSALDTWKRGESAETLKTGTNPVEFHDDDWQKSARLLEYELLNVYPDTDKLPRCAVRLVIQHRKQEPAVLKVTYQIVTTPKIIVGRDPFS